MIGSGTIVPDRDRGMAGHHVRCGDISCLLDLGSGTLGRLHRFGIAAEAIDIVAVSHRHQDHIGDLLPLLFSFQYRPDARRARPLTIVGYTGLLQDLERLSAVFGDWVVEPEFGVRIVEMGALPLTIDRGDSRVEIDAGSVDHTPEAVGFRLRLVSGDREVSLVYTGDTGEGEAAVALARGADVLVAECSTTDEVPIPGHLSPGALGRIAASAGVGRVVVSHRYPAVLALGTEAPLRQIGEHYAGPVIPGSDGLAIEL